MVRKILSVIVIILGVGIILTPSLKHYYYMEQQKKVMEDLDNQMKSVHIPTQKRANKNLDKSDHANINNKQSEIKDNKNQGAKNQAPISDTDKSKEEEVNKGIVGESQEPRTSSVIKEAIGIIKIPEIDLTLPLFSKATTSYLNIGPCQIEGTGELGDAGNVVVAGHRNYRYGDQFNRLNELIIDNLIIIETLETEYVYKITDKFIVEAEDVWVMDQVAEEKIITLITCHPINTGERRLIVRGQQLKVLGDN